MHTFRWVPLPLLLLPGLAAAQDSELDPIVVQSTRLEAARINIAPALGASVYEIDRTTIDRLPQGSNASLNQVLLQAPSVAGDAQGDIRVRGDHRNLQYRINGVIIPEAISGFAQLFDARSLRSVSLITGALPAQFGYRTAGIVDIRLRSGALEPGGTAAIYGGSFGTVQPSLAYGGAVGPFEYYLTGSLLSSSRGFENPTRSYDAINNDTQQLRGLMNLAYVVDDRTRVAFIGGTSQSRYQIPASPGQPAGFTAFGQDNFDSAGLRSRQWQRATFGVLALQHSREALDVQVSAFARQTSLNYLPDLVGEMVGNGTASETRKSNVSVGFQVDAAWRVAERHTIRAGLIASSDFTRNNTNTFALPLDAMGSAVDAPVNIQERGRINQQLYGIYLQDEWRIADRLTMNFGARFDVLQGPSDATQLSPRVNLVWRPTDTTTLAIGYARYFTPPPAELLTRPDLARYAATTAEPGILLANAVRPERSNYFNAGVRQRIGEFLTLGAEAYYKDSKNLQDMGQFGAAYIFSPFNYARGRVYGAELSASYRRNSLLLYGNLAYGRAEGRAPSSNQFLIDPADFAYAQNRYVRLDHEQTITGSAGAAYRIWEGGNLAGTLIYASGLRSGFANSQSVTPYLTANLTFSQTVNLPRIGEWTARVDVLNLGDRIYQLRDGTGIGVGAAQFGMRRAVFFGLSRAL
ncbi:MAG: TonB-dependent receptor [Roseococcus sp.]|nr:TonB-dependent receptor [Roseococcus sp.]